LIATLFDFNGVLVDDEAVHLAAFREVVRPLGIELTDAMYSERYLGFDDAGAFRAMLLDAGLAATTQDVARLIEAKKPVYMRRAFDGGELVVFDGARELVERRAKLGKVGIVSGALRHEIEHALEAMKVRAAVDFIVSAEDTTECKPHPQGYLRGIAALGIDLDGPAAARTGVVVLEDSLAGVAAAKNAGLRCAAVATSYPEAQLSKAGADVVVATLLDLDDALFDGAGGP
jgi:HAD superfamily hydrolase (TIGR01509 family)